jgi:hypothetical protein
VIDNAVYFGIKYTRNIMYYGGLTRPQVVVIVFKFLRERGLAESMQMLRLAFFILP